MRAVGALAVVATHVAFWSGAYTQSDWGPLLARLDVGVALFFVLSGFLLSRPHLDRRARGLAPPPPGRYLWKRVLRIYPLYVVAASAALVLLPENAGASARDWISTLTLADLYLEESFPAGLTQMWSLATEVAFYLCLPALMLLALGRDRSGGVPVRRLVVFLVGMCVVNVVWLLDLAARVDVEAQVLQWLPSYLTWFAAGVALAAVDVLGSHRRDLALPAAVAELGRYAGTCWIAAGTLLVIASTPIAGPTLLLPPTEGEALTRNLLYAAASALMILPAIHVETTRTRLARWLAVRPLRHLGHISYGIFCVHMLLLELIAEWGDFGLFEGRGPLLFVLVTLASVLVAEVLYRAVELPFMRLRDLRPPWRRRPSQREESPTASMRTEQSTRS
jgi:peptidoglycan/LPS O-acetylase OafA/YrhL